MKDETPPRRKKPEDKRNPGDKRDHAGEEKTEDSGSPSREDVISRWQNPVTNQDEQEKITNTGDDDIPVPDK